MSPAGSGTSCLLVSHFSNVSPPQTPAHCNYSAVGGGVAHRNPSPLERMAVDPTGLYGEPLGAELQSEVSSSPEVIPEGLRQIPGAGTLGTGLKPFPCFRQS